MEELKKDFLEVKDRTYSLALNSSIRPTSESHFSLKSVSEISNDHEHTPQR